MSLFLEEPSEHSNIVAVISETKSLRFIKEVG